MTITLERLAEAKKACRQINLENRNFEDTPIHLEKDSTLATSYGRYAGTLLPALIALVEEMVPMVCWASTFPCRHDIGMDEIAPEFPCEDDACLPCSAWKLTRRLEGK